MANAGARLAWGTMLNIIATIVTFLVAWIAFWFLLCFLGWASTGFTCSYAETLTWAELQVVAFLFGWIPATGVALAVAD